MKNQKVYNLIILDESGSMESIKTEIISAFNEIVQNIKGLEEKFPGQEHFVSFVTFNSLGIKTILDRNAVSKLLPISNSVYNPDSMTPLYDAIGVSTNKLEKDIEGIPGVNVYVTIITDGLENASKEYSGKAVKQRIDNLKSSGWEFTYIGTDHDVINTAESLFINKIICFDKSEVGISMMVDEEHTSRLSFFRKLADEFKIDDLDNDKKFRKYY